MELTVRLEAVGAPDPAARRPGRRRQIRWESGGGQRASSGGHPRPPEGRIGISLLGGCRISMGAALLMIRKSLSSHAPHALGSSDATIALDDSQVQVDVTTLERSVADATHEALERITSVCVGPFLEGFAAGSAPFDEWIASERARLQE